jgi:hypothetical protein
MKLEESDCQRRIFWNDGWKSEWWSRSRRPLLDNGQVNTCSRATNVNKGIPMTTKQNRGTVKHGDFYPGRVEVIKAVDSWIRENRDQSKIQTVVRDSFREIHQTDVVRKEFNVWAVVSDFNCKEVPINPIIKSITHFYSSRKPRTRDNFWKSLYTDW